MHDANTTEKSHGIYSPKQVQKLTTLSAPTIWRMAKRGDFPKPIELSPGRVGYRQSEVDPWLEQRKSRG
jgi:prophage regulatory protein